MPVCCYATRLYLPRLRPALAHHFTTSSPSTSTFQWNSAIKSDVESGHFDSALARYRQMRELGVPHDTFTFPIINRAISALDGDIRSGGMVHALATHMGFGKDVYFCNTMIALYARYGVLSDARKLFDDMSVRDLVSWTSMISGYVRGKGPCEVFFGFELFGRMRLEFLEINSVVLIVMLQACCAAESASVGLQFHGYVVKLGFMADFTVQNSLMKMYADKFHGNEVEDIFGELDQKDLVSWNTMMSYYTAQWRFDMVIETFNDMQKEIIGGPSIDTLPLVVSTVAKAGCELWQGEMLHCAATKVGLHDSVLKTSLVDLYAKCGEIEKASKLFKEDPSANNSVTECALISGFNCSGRHQEAIEQFRRIRAAGSYVGIEIAKEIILACAHLGTLRMGKAVHCYLVRNFHNLEEDASHGTCILNFYIRCGTITYAKHCFNRILGKDIVAWTSMVEGLGNHGRGREALTCFDQMIHEGVAPNNLTFLSLMSACSHSGLVQEGCDAFCSMRWKHNIKPELEHYTCVVDLLGRSGKLKAALLIIIKMVVHPDSRIWGALLSASKVHGDIKMGLYAAQRLLQLEPENVGYRTLLSNIHASGCKWEEVGALRRWVNTESKKEPGWSYIEENSIRHGFVSGDRSLHQMHLIHETLGCLCNHMQEADYGDHNSLTRQSTEKI
uniref:Pentatricopeptide repeat-containing protein n=1 Tax=Kalanchoe fedtschenkoi TaxID=63787 RepID=A0A7N0UEY4_KALFE